ncbi:UNVERIFIED_CONTAM: hypothetical protein Sradi_6643900 [Sesamum radiatum]|uniref:Uncharacterized protein n=1 Tax=Sesamum radiatum TaxID=300843 RepID=A0AAW2JZV5_SESRA
MSPDAVYTIGFLSVRRTFRTNQFSFSHTVAPGLPSRPPPAFPVDSSFLDDPSSRTSTKQQKLKLKFPPKKSFAEILTGAYKPRYDELQKFFLADLKPTMVGTRVDIDGRPTLIFNDMETLSFTAAYRYALVGIFSHGAPQYRNLHRLISPISLGTDGRGRLHWKER